MMPRPFWLAGSAPRVSPMARRRILSAAGVAVVAAIAAAILVAMAGGSPQPVFKQLDATPTPAHTLVAPGTPSPIDLTAATPAEAVRAVLDLDQPPRDATARLWFETESSPEAVRDFFQRRWSASPRAAAQADGDSADAYLLAGGGWTILTIVSRAPNGSIVSVLVM